MSTVSQTSPISIYTSVAGKTDYRYGQDFTLVNPDSMVTDFADTVTPAPVLLPVTNLWAQWLPSSGIAGINWSVKQSPAGVIGIVGGNAGNLATNVDST